jgi:hypothetical protein
LGLRSAGEPGGGCKGAPKRKSLDAFAFGKDTTGFDEEVASFGEDVLDEMI